jgi:hypothetical protein
MVLVIVHRGNGGEVYIAGGRRWSGWSAYNQRSHTQKFVLCVGVGTGVGRRLRDRESDADQRVKRKTNAL